MVQLKRADLVKLALASLREKIAQEIRDSAAAERVARDEFIRAMRAEAVCHYNDVLSRLCDMCGTHLSRIVADVHLEPTDDVLTSPPIGVSLTLRDDELYSARVVLRIRMAAQDAELRAWFEAVRRRQRAEARGVRTKDLDADARAKMVDDLLTTLPEGRAALDALSVFSRAAAEHGD